MLVIIGDDVATQFVYLEMDVPFFEAGCDRFPDPDSGVYSFHLFPPHLPYPFGMVGWVDEENLQFPYLALDINDDSAHWVFTV